jgi:hypothetical protein
MPMTQVYEYSQSADPFAAEPQGVCQALAARWIVSRALWDPRRDEAWDSARWMGSKRDMEAHVWRIYGATRAARAAVENEERTQMADVLARFNRQKDELVRKDRRRAVRVDFADATLAQGYTPPGYSSADLERQLAQVRIPALPRMLDAVMRDVSEHGGLAGSVHTTRSIPSSGAGAVVCGLGKGYKLIVARDVGLAGEGGAHALAAEIREDESRLFDPNYGEWKSEGVGVAASFNLLMHFLLERVYKLGQVDYLSIIHFPLKAGQS